MRVGALRERLVPQLRALFVAFHVLAVLAAATPSTASALRRSAWSDPTVQAEFAAWAPRLGLTPEALEERLWGFAVGYNEVRVGMMRPFRPYFELVGAEQSWQMFVAPHTHPTRLEIAEARAPLPKGRAGEPEGGWQLLFRERDPDADWMARAMGNERVRASVFRWGWSAYAASYKKACRALANRRFAEDSEVTGIRCRFEKTRTPTAAQVRAGAPVEGRWVSPFVVERPR